jgi:5,10-methylenetetrahydrofolate reductase
MALQPIPDRESLRYKMEQEQFVVTVELLPPRSPDLENIRTRLRKFFVGNADGVNVTDCASAMLRMSSMGASLICLESGLDPVMQITCRDRNRIALQSELITAYAYGVRNILCLSGDHVTFGDHPEAKPVFDMDSTNLIAMVSRMRAEGKYCCGDEIRTSKKSNLICMDWLIGGAANPFGNQPEHLALHMDKKRRAGVDFIQTQPVFDPDGFAAWWRALEALELPRALRILPGILPPKTAKGLAFMKENVPGVWIPDACLRRLESAQDVQAESKKMTLETVDRLLQYPIAGFHVYPVYWEEYVPELVAEIRERARRAGRKVTVEVQGADDPTPREPLHTPA